MKCVDTGITLKLELTQGTAMDVRVVKLNCNKLLTAGVVYVLCRRTYVGLTAPEYYVLIVGCDSRNADGFKCRCGIKFVARWRDRLSWT